jgi:hypothetical protein
MTSNARTTLHEVGRLARVSRHPRTAVWFPLAVFGLIDIPGAVLVQLIGREHLGLYYFPVSAAGGVLCAWHYRRVGRTTGLQVPALVWLVVVMAVTVAGAVCSVTGREQGWDMLNLGGPGISRMSGYLLLAAWARSTALLAVVVAIGAITVLVVASVRGNTAISLQLIGYATVMLLTAIINRSTARASA